MAIINSYPTITPKAGDLVILTDTSTTPNSTKTATVSSINAISTAPDIITISKTFTSAQILTLAGALPTLTLVDAPGENKSIVVVSAACFLNFNTTQYNFNADLQLAIKTDPFANISNTLINSSSSKAIAIPLFTTAGGDEVPLNRSLTLKSNSATVSTGDSPITFNIAYRVVDFS